MSDSILRRRWCAPHDGGPLRQRGAGTIEYVLVALLVVLVLVAGPDVMSQLAAAVRAAYSAMVYTLSASWL